VFRTCTYTSFRAAEKTACEDFSGRASHTPAKMTPKKREKRLPML
jgi:hypothetical protein